MTPLCWDESVSAEAHHYLRIVRKYRCDDVLETNLLWQMTAVNSDESRAASPHWACNNDARRWTSKLLLKLLYCMAGSAI